MWLRCWNFRLKIKSLLQHKNKSSSTKNKQFSPSHLCASYPCCEDIRDPRKLKTIENKLKLIISCHSIHKWTLVYYTYTCRHSRTRRVLTQNHFLIFLPLKFLLKRTQSPFRPKHRYLWWATKQYMNADENFKSKLQSHIAWGGLQGFKLIAAAAAAAATATAKQRAVCLFLWSYRHRLNKWD